ncbi:MAG: chromate resistance protein ChrB domain-containing protein [SAR324 cluster bacterium]
MLQKNARWLVMLISLPPTTSRVRVGVWRKLKRMGAVSLKGAAWILPENGETTELFQWLMQEIESLKGEVALLHVDRIEPLHPEQVVNLFHQDRGAEYEEVRRQCEAVLASLARGSEPAPDALRRLKSRLATAKRELDRIARIDYLHAPAGDPARKFYEQAEMKLTSTGERPSKARARKAEGMPPLRSRWVTRPRPHIDRIGSAWLIKRFYDPQARFAFVKDPKAVKQDVPFDVLGVEFGHHGEDCTFETVVKRLGLKDRRLKEIGEIVHDADLQDGKFSRAESAGLDLTLRGLAATHGDDHELLEAGMGVFDGLYAALTARR